MRVALSSVVVWLISSSISAHFANVPVPRVDEVPIERLLANLEQNPRRLPPAEQARAIGRLHLLAHLRATATLPVYRDRPTIVAEGAISLCSNVDRRSSPRPAVPPPPPGPQSPASAERCADATYSVGPEPELPPDWQRPLGAVDAHLHSALKAYTDARRLDPSNLRTRLALAFVSERRAERGRALAELRALATDGLTRLPRPSGRASEPAHSDWETHTVISEGAEHLARLATSTRDRRLVARMRARLDAVPPIIAVTPILVPLGGATAIETLIDRHAAVRFDFSGQGIPMRAGWLTPRAAWLVWDPKDHRRIDGGFQLFGSVTWLSFWNNGYQALGTLDDDGDGELRGAELWGLALWDDRNGDGISTALEVRPVRAHGIVALRYAHARVSDDLWISANGVTLENGDSRPTYDWIVRAMPSSSGRRTQ